MMKKLLKILIILLLFVPVSVLSANILGDVNGDNKVSSLDYIMVRKHLLKVTILNGNELSKADVNNDGKVSTIDYITIRKIIMGEKPSSTIAPTAVPTSTPTTVPINIKEFNIHNDGLVAYLKTPTQIETVYNNYCSGSACSRPRKYNTSLTGDINLYQYDEKTKTKTLIKTINANDINYYLIPNKTFYLESKNDPKKYEAVRVTGKIRMIYDSILNFRDLGGWNADGGTIKYGRIYRSSNTDSLSENTIKALNLKRIIDLREVEEINPTSVAAKNIRLISTVVQYNIDKKYVRETVIKIMNAVVNENMNIIFNCKYGKDRTGTVAFILEGLLGLNSEELNEDYELSYFYDQNRTRNKNEFVILKDQINSYGKTKYDQERFINWFLSASTTKSSDLDLLNKFRKAMINGTPHEYNWVDNKLVLK